MRIHVKMELAGRRRGYAWRSYLCITLLCALLPPSASAVQWQSLGRTERHDVDLDMDSVRQTTFGRLAAWLRFTPRGERQRREAAAEYGKKEYLRHLEYYEIDCGEQSALLGRIDFLGNGGKRLGHMTGGGQPDIITPGSILELAAQQVCPALEEAVTYEDDAPEADENQTIQATPDDKPIPEEARQRIAEAVQRTELNPGSAAAWADLGNVYFDADLPRQAIKAYGRALSLEPENSDVLNDQGAMYRQIGEFDQALKNFTQALTIDPGNLESIYNMGYVYAFDLNRMDRARQQWRRYLELDHSSERSREVQSFLERYAK